LDTLRGVSAGVDERKIFGDIQSDAERIDACGSARQ
jgi:hypothetical protein